MFPFSARNKIRNVNFNNKQTKVLQNFFPLRASLGPLHFNTALTGDFSLLAMTFVTELVGVMCINKMLYWRTVYRRSY